MKQLRIGDITIDAVIEREGPWRRSPTVGLIKPLGAAFDYRFKRE